MFFLGAGAAATDILPAVLILKDRRMRPLVVTGGVFLAGLSLNTWFYAHYAAPITGLIYRRHRPLGDLKSLLSALGIDLPAGGVVVLPRTLIVSLIVGVVITVISAALPAVKTVRPRSPPCAESPSTSPARRKRAWRGA